MRIAFDFLRDLREGAVYILKASEVVRRGGGGRGHSCSAVRLNEVYEVAREACTVVSRLIWASTRIANWQLFHDLNNLSKKVEASLAFEFDNSNPIK